MSDDHSEVYIDPEGEQRCVTCDKWLERDYYTIDDHRRREAAKRLTQWGLENQPDDLRARIAAVLPQIFDRIADGELVEWGDMADAVIRELDGQLIDFALWLSEELRGEPLSRIDAESCLQEWKWLNDESRWLKDGD